MQVDGTTVEELVIGYSDDQTSAQEIELLLPILRSGQRGDCLSRLFDFAGARNGILPT